ncbi:MAG: heavy-metal-associated domain-containing protein [Clostridia bacterium]|nr:heavy-metal-associated domain-containing protein [Clostridia bacterium]
MKEAIIKVNGMMCTGCENRVKNALSELAGIEGVEASFAEGIVKVILNEQINIEVIKEKIEDLGFETM